MPSVLHWLDVLLHRDPSKPKPPPKSKSKTRARKPPITFPPPLDDVEKPTTSSTYTTPTMLADRLAAKKRHRCRRCSADCANPYVDPRNWDASMHELSLLETAILDLCNAEAAATSFLDDCLDDGFCDDCCFNRHAETRNLSSAEKAYLRHRLMTRASKFRRIEDAALSMDDACHVCLFRRATIQSLPCDHGKICRFCAVQIINDHIDRVDVTCPLCYTCISRFLRSVPESDENEDAQRRPDYYDVCLELFNKPLEFLGRDVPCGPATTGLRERN